MKKLFSAIAILAIPFMANAQKKIGRYNNQISFGIGSSHFSGDVGGSGSLLSNEFMNSDLTDTRLSFMLGFKHRVNDYLNLRSDLSYFILKADDFHSDNIQKKSRNLSFRSINLSTELMLEFYIFGQNQVEEYPDKGAVNVYLIGGVGGILFNPKAKDRNGQWVALQPLGTEGQGMPGEKEKYNRIALVVPYGIGFSKRLDFGWSINFDLMMHQSFSDYLDDVSTDYYNAESLSEQDGTAAFFGNGKAVYSQDMGGANNSSAGMVRGNPYNQDAYFFCMFSISKRLSNRGR